MSAQLSLEFQKPGPAAPKSRISARYRLDLVHEATVPYLVDELPTLNRPTSLAHFLWSTIFEREPREVLVALFLDCRHRPIGHMIASTGGLHRTIFEPRTLLAAALLHNAYGLVIAHNHPSGSLEPSSEDRLATRRLQEGAELLGLQLCDHLIVGEGGRFVSLRAIEPW